MAVTTSFHSGSQVSFRHNTRDEKMCAFEDHIDLSMEHEAWGVGVDGQSLEKVYDEIFGEAVRDYDARQTRDDRKIGNYYEKIRQEQAAGGRFARKLVYESILTVGNYTNYNDQYASSAEQIPPEKAKEMIMEAVRKIDNSHRNIRIVGVYWHNDEFHTKKIGGQEQVFKGAPHVHIDWVPVATGFQRGMEVQNSLARALIQEGYDYSGPRATPQIKFQNACRNMLDEVVKEHGYEVTHPKMENEIARQNHRDKLDYVAEQLDRQNTALAGRIAEIQAREAAAEVIIASSKKALHKPIEELEPVRIIGTTAGKGKAIAFREDDFAEREAVIAERLNGSALNESLSQAVSELRTENSRKIMQELRGPDVAADLRVRVVEKELGKLKTENEILRKECKTLKSKNEELTKENGRLERNRDAWKRDYNEISESIEKRLAEGTGELERRYESLEEKTERLMDISRNYVPQKVWNRAVGNYEWDSGTLSRLAFEKSEVEAGRMAEGDLDRKVGHYLSGCEKRHIAPDSFWKDYAEEKGITPREAVQERNERENRTDSDRHAR